jgi:5-enolpyruvylshikimate-3-phosphate synthase
MNWQMTLVAIAAIIGFVTIVAIGPEDLSEYGDFLTAALVAVVGAITMMQNRSSRAEIKNVHDAVNSGAERELKAKGEQSRAEGVLATREDFQPIIDEAIAKAVVAALASQAQASAHAIGHSTDEPPAPRAP